MRIAFWGMGYLLPDKLSSDGNYLGNLSLIKSLKKLGHKIYWIGPVRTKEAKGDKNFPDALYYQFNKLIPYDYELAVKAQPKYKKCLERSHAWFNGELATIKYPTDVDFVILQSHNVLGTQYFATSVTRFYTKRKIKVFIWDTDNWARNSAPLHPFFEVDHKYVYFMTRYKKQKFQNQFEFYFGYDKEFELNPIPAKFSKTHFCYIGNNYKREAKLIKFYSSVPAHIYGNFKKDKNNIKEKIGIEKFKGQIPPEDVMNTLSQYYACIQIARPDYEKLGQQAPRINECAQAGTICFIDKDIRDCEHWTLKDQIISDSKQAIDRLNSFIKNKEIKDRVLRHRKMLPTNEQQIPKLLSVFKTGKV